MAPELGGMLAAAILKVVTGQIGSAIAGQIKLKHNFTKDLANMKTTLESVEALLDDAERRSITHKPTRLWLKDLKKAMYAISDMLDEFEADTQGFVQPSAHKFPLRKHVAIMIRHCLTIAPNYNLAKKMKSIREDLKEITDRHKNFNLLVSTNASELNVSDERETISSIDVQIFGRNEERDKILAYLSHNSMIQDCLVFAIYGIGGLGKTTLAQMVYNSSQYTGYSLVWIYVSQTFDLRKIGNSIISQISKIETSYNETQMVHNSLLELLAGKKILVVLDDLWEVKDNDWNKLMAMLVGKGSKVIIIVTTRSKDIASKVSTNQPHELALLQNEVCWSIIEQKTNFESIPNKEELKDIGMSIARKCGGVALAAQTLGFVLKNQDIHLWRSVMNNDIWALSDSEDPDFRNVIASLMLSYSVMPKDLKLCFSYCAIFQKGHKIIKSDLIQQWISLDFIKPTNVRSCWDTAEGCIRKLVGLAFLQESSSSLTVGVNLEDDTVFTMHDLVHDLARSVMFDEIIVSSEDNSNWGSCVRYALINNCSKPLESSTIRALRFMDCGEIELHGAAFSSAKSLRILDLSECFIRKLPDSFGLLKQLRYLNAPRIQDTTIPDIITSLSKLTYLNLHESSAISALPESIGHIQGLLYIDLSGCSGIEKLPESLAQIKNLVHLNLSNCSRVGDVSFLFRGLTELQYLNSSYCPNIGKLPGALGGLTKLKYLNLSFSSYLECSQEGEVLGALTNLEYLNLSCECCPIKKLPEALGNFVNLKYLNLSGFQYLRRLPGLFVNLKNLVHLDLSNFPLINDVPESLGGLTNLQYLNLSIPRQDMLMIGTEQPRLKGLQGVICNLTKLRYLNLSSCTGSIFGSSCNRSSKDQVDGFMYCMSTLSNLEHLDLSSNKHIVSIPQSFCSLRKLHTLDLSHCICLSMIPESIGIIDSLKILIVTGCEYLSKLPQLNSTAVSLPHFAVHPGYGESSSTLFRLKHTNHVVLEITKLEMVKSPEEAHDISLTEKHKLTDLTLEWSRGAEWFVDDKMLLEKLVPPRTLKTLKIHGYRSGSFPAWLMDIAHNLPNLVTIELCNFPNFSVLPSLGQLRNLTSLLLQGLESLEECNMPYSSGEEHAIERLEIHDCTKLKITLLPTNVKSLVLTGLESLEEWNMSYSSGKEHVIERLKIHDCPKLRIKLLPPRAKWLEISTSDSVLSSWGEYTGASTTTSYPVDTTLRLGPSKLPMHQWRLLQHLPGLTRLDITGCDDLNGSLEIIQHLSSLRALLLEDTDLEELPIWLGELTSLQILKISMCSGLEKLNDSMRQLIELRILGLISCSSITSLPHWLGELTSLENLEILLCDAISSLPEGIQQLTNLTTLNIAYCPELEEWCQSEENKTKLAHIKLKIWNMSMLMDEYSSFLDTTHDINPEL